MEVSKITYTGSRFAPGVKSTIMFPFSSSKVKLTITGGTVYEFTGVAKENGVWTVKGTQLASGVAIDANKPYIFECSGSELKFETQNGNNKISLNTGSSSSYSYTVGDWEFVGTYKKITWGEGNEELGTIFGLAADDKTVNGKDIKKGSFVKGAAGASVKPMRAFLRYKEQQAQARPGANGVTRASVAKLAGEDLPESMVLKLYSADGSVASIGRINTLTGEITTDHWVDLKGRRLDKAPTVPGTYYNNRQKVIVH